MARTTDYKKKYLQSVDDYLSSRQDSEENFLIKVTSKGTKEYIPKLVVKLPTIEGFAEFIGVSRKTVYNWAKADTYFAQGLERIKNEQLRRLVDEGLANNYNPTIAKLILSHNHGMKERWDGTSDDEPLTHFNDEQIDKIAQRIAGRKGTNGDTPSQK
jgi:hypothetical protein